MTIPSNYSGNLKTKNCSWAPNSLQNSFFKSVINPFNINTPRDVMPVALVNNLEIHAHKTNPQPSTKIFWPVRVLSFFLIFETVNARECISSFEFTQLEPVNHPIELLTFLPKVFELFTRSLWKTLGYFPIQRGITNKRKWRRKG